MDKLWAVYNASTEKFVSRPYSKKNFAKAWITNTIRWQVRYNPDYVHPYKVVETLTDWYPVED